MMNIKSYGWDEYFEREWNQKCTYDMRPGLVTDKACYPPMQPGLVVGKANCSSMHPGRIVADYGQMLRVVADAGEFLLNRPLKKLNKDIQLAVGDWVVLGWSQTGSDAHPCNLKNSEETQSVYVRDVLTRKTKFSRAAAGIEVREQIVAANVDTVFIIQSLNRDFNMRRLERYLIAAWESGAVPAVVLTKADCCDDVSEKKRLYIVLRREWKFMSSVV